MRLARELIRYLGASAAALALDVSLLWLQISIKSGVPLPCGRSNLFLSGTAFVYYASVSRIFGFRRLDSAGTNSPSSWLSGSSGSRSTCHHLHRRLAFRLPLPRCKDCAAGFTFLQIFALRRWLLFTPWARGRDAC